MSRLIAILLFVLSSFALAQSTITLDDADRLLVYAGSWSHDTNGADYLSAGTQSWTNDPAGTLSFSVPMTGFDLCAGKKADRGTFSITIDGVQSGSGSEQGANTQEGACGIVASVKGLSGNQHGVVLANSGASYFAVDHVIIYNDLASSSSPVEAVAAAEVTSEVTLTTTAGRPRATSTIISMSILGASPSSISSAVASSESQEASSTKMDSKKRAAIIGGSLAGGFILALLLAIGAWQIVKRQATKNRDRDSFAPSEYDTGARVVDEKNFNWASSEKQPMSHAAGPAGGFSPSNSSGGIASGAALPRSIGLNNLHKRTGSKPDSLDSHTSEPYHPEVLEHQPEIEPYYPARFTPTQSRHESMNSTSSVAGVGAAIQNVFNSPPRTAQATGSNIQHPYDFGPLKTKNSYDRRLAAASANLPDFKPPASVDAPIPRQHLLYPTSNAPRVLSTASSAYPPTETGRQSAMPDVNEDPYADSHSIAYSGIEAEDEEDDLEEEERRRRATRCSENPFETYSLYERAHDGLESRKSRAGTLGPAWRPEQ